jgi:predicted nucleotidyltransferase
VAPVIQQSEAVLAELSAHRPELDSQGVRSLFLFGSTARNEAKSESDVDLVVEFDRPVGFFALTRLRLDLEAWLGRRVDLLTVDALRPEIRERVIREALRTA